MRGLKYAYAILRPYGGFVAPHVGAWIEIKEHRNEVRSDRSHPTWVRGLKLEEFKGSLKKQGVAPHVGAWIEIQYMFQDASEVDVAPHVGAWIEIRNIWKFRWSDLVAPHVGAWIEMQKRTEAGCPIRSSHPTWVRGLKYAGYIASFTNGGRTPRGCVD